MIRTRIYRVLKKLYVFFEPLPIFGAIARLFVKPAETWLGPKRRKIFGKKPIKGAAFGMGFSAAVDGLKRQISEQNKKIDGLEKEMAVLSQHNRYLLLYIGAANEFPGKVEKKVSE
jgi:hypothetical protein